MKHLVAIGLIIFSNVLTAQQENLKPTLIDNTDPTRWVYIAPAADPGLVGDQYFFKDWQVAKIVFRKGVVKDGLLVNYNLEEEELEIATSEGLKIFPAGSILSWEADDKQFRSFFDFGNTCIPEGKKYAQVLSDSNAILLLKVTDLKKRNPSYNEKLGIGDNNYRYMKSTRLVILKNGQCEEISGSASKREKLFIDFFGNQRITKIMDEQNLDLKSEEDLIRLIDQLSDGSI